MSGYGQGGSLMLEQVDPTFVHVVGTDGEVARCKKGNPLVKITVTLMQTAIANTVLSGIHTADKLAPNGILLPFALVDTGGASIFASSASWIEGFPAAEFTNEAKDRVWVIFAIGSLHFLGNN